MQVYWRTFVYSKVWLKTELRSRVNRSKKYYNKPAKRSRFYSHSHDNVKAVFWRKRIDPYSIKPELYGKNETRLFWAHSLHTSWFPSKDPKTWYLQLFWNLPRLRTCSAVGPRWMGQRGLYLCTFHARFLSTPSSEHNMCHSSMTNFYASTRKYITSWWKGFPWFGAFYFNLLKMVLLLTKKEICSPSSQFSLHLWLWYYSSAGNNFLMRNLLAWSLHLTYYRTLTKQAKTQLHSSRSRPLSQFPGLPAVVSLPSWRKLPRVLMETLQAGSLVQRLFAASESSSLGGYWLFCSFNVVFGSWFCARLFTGPFFGGG